MTNAFQRANWNLQDETLAELVRPPKDLEIYAKRCKQGAVCLLELAGEQKATDLLPSAGTLVGDPGSVALFARSLKKPTVRWDVKLNNSDEAFRLLLVRDPITDSSSDLGLTKYADDAKRIHVLVTGTKEEIESRIKHSTAILDEELLGGVFVQHQSKKKLVPTWRGPVPGTHYIASLARRARASKANGHLSFATWPVSSAGAATTLRSREPSPLELFDRQTRRH